MQRLSKEENKGKRVRNQKPLRIKNDNWYNLSPVIYEELVISMPRRVAAALQAKIGATCYGVDVHEVSAFRCICDFDEDKKRSEEETELEEYVQMVSKLLQHKRVHAWEQKRWNDYIFKTKEMDSLQLPVVNAFITEWEDDLSYEIEEIFHKSHRSLQCSETFLAAVAEWYRYRTVACFVTGSSPVPLKTRHVGQRCTLNLSRAETSSRWCGVVVRRGGASSGVVHVT
ncbi:uncharacterized protein TNCV_4808511 [Trichonephila clavipes]|nr:uncharacterized protein TNCV_4808511 [Trichonephila clavipes]